jgi:predicted anti-sigma-YlaC factor YlaD
MSFFRCSHDAELKTEMESGHWPEASTGELRAHVAECRACRDAVRLQQSFRSARAVTLAQPQLPPPGLIWWRAQLRRRNAAFARVQRPIVGAQILALLVTVAIGAGMVIVELQSDAGSGISLSGWLSSLSPNALFRTSAVHLEGFLSAASSMVSGNLYFLTPALVVLAVMGGLAALLATDKS